MKTNMTTEISLGIESVNPVTLSADWSRVARLLLLASLASIGSIGNVFMISAVMIEDFLRKRGNSIYSALLSILPFSQFHSSLCYRSQWDDLRILSALFYYWFFKKSKTYSFMIVNLSLYVCIFIPFLLILFPYSLF